MILKTSELTGVALDWAVAKCEGVDSEWLIEDNFFHEHYNGGLRYSTDWAQGGPIIERETISIEYTGNIGRAWFAKPPGNPTRVRKQMMDGPTPLIAAMRCYVASKLGDTVDIPEELL
jgi:hypothetical protein